MALSHQIVTTTMAGRLDDLEGITHRSERYRIVRLI